MIGFADFDDLVDTVLDYGHAPSLKDRAERIFVPFASLRIGRDLRSSANEDLAVLDAAALGDPFAVPADFASIRSITPQDSRRLALRSKDEVTITAMPDQGDRALAYNIRNRAVTVRPFKAISYDFSYHTVPVLDAVNTSNEVLESYPFLYLYAALIELYVYRQDGEQRAIALQTYLDEVQLTSSCCRCQWSVLDSG